MILELVGGPLDGGYVEANQNIGDFEYTTHISTIHSPDGQERIETHLYLRPIKDSLTTTGFIILKYHGYTFTYPNESSHSSDSQS